MIVLNCVVRENKNYIEGCLNFYKDTRNDTIRRYIDLFENTFNFGFFEFRKLIKNISIDSINSAGFDKIYYNLQDFEKDTPTSGYHYFIDNDDFVIKGFKDIVYNDLTGFLIRWNLAKYINDSNTIYIGESDYICDSNNYIVNLPSKHNLPIIQHYEVSYYVNYYNIDINSIPKVLSIENKNITSISNTMDGYGIPRRITKDYLLKYVDLSISLPKNIDAIPESLGSYIKRMCVLYEDLL
jgi:hypothetical protein